MTISVDLDKLLNSKLKIEEYFVLFCLVNHLDDMLVKYVTICGKIDAGVFQKLKDSGYIILKDEANISFDSIVLTDQSKTLMGVNNSVEFDILFKELLGTYPNKVKRVTGGTRRFHNDLEKCKKTYKLTLLSIGKLNVELHKKILLCIKMYYQEHLKDNKVEFMQALPAFLNQKTWEQFLPEVANLTEVPKQTTNVDAI